MDISNYSPIKGTSIRLVSLSGQVIQELKNTDEMGRALRCSVEELKNGGVDAVTFSVDRRSNIPTFTGMLIEIFKDTELFATVYSDTVPQPGSDSNILEIICKGFKHRLDEFVLTKSYTSQTLSAIIADQSTDLATQGVTYNAGNIDLPNVTVASLEFTEKTLLEVVETVIAIANEDFNNHEYRWYIDKERVLNIEEISQTPIRNLFEGFNYQSPTVEVDDSDLVNTVIAYTADVDNNLTLVGTFEDTDSKGIYGVKDRKVVFPDTLDATSMEALSLGIIEQLKEPETKVSLDNLQGVDYPFAFYLLSNRIDTYWQVLSECDSFDNWNISGAVNTVVTLDTTTVLTGRRSIKCDVGLGSNGEEIVLTPDSPIFSPSILRLYFYLEEQFSFDVIVKSISGETTSFTLGLAELKMEANDTGSTTKNIEADISAGTRNIVVNIQVSYVDQWIKIDILLDIRALEDVTIRFSTDADTVAYFDRFEVLSKAYDTKRLTLERITYNLDRDFALSKAEFGREFETLTKSIKDEVEAGDIALALAARS